MESGGEIFVISTATLKLKRIVGDARFQHRVEMRGVNLP